MRIEIELKLVSGRGQPLVSVQNCETEVEPQLPHNNCNNSTNCLIMWRYLAEGSTRLWEVLRAPTQVDVKADFAAASISAAVC